jgi:hypothetical protein
MTSVRTVLSPLPLFDQSDRRHLGISDTKRTPAVEEENFAAHSNLATQEVLH